MTQYDQLGLTTSAGQTKEEVKVVKEQSQEEAKVLATERCLRNLFQTDPLEDKNKLKRKKGGRAAGTCEWIVNTDILVGWLGTTQSSPEAPLSNILWLHGNPGIGKSTMSIFLVEELSNVFSAKPENTLAWFFCDSTVEHRRTATSVLRGLIWQFVQQHPRLLGYVSPKYEERGLKLFESFDALWLIFMNLVKDEATGRKFCVIDALDECDPESQETLLRQLNDTFGLERAIHTQNISILITSRPYSEIREHLEQFTNKDLASFPESQEDIHHLIDNKVADLTKSKRFTAKIAGQVTNILRDRAEGTFLWVGLACDELKNVASKDVIKRLHSLPEGLHALYKKLLDDAVQETNSRDVFRRIMTFVLVAGRPLSVADLATACMLHQDEEDKETREQFARDEIASCRLMVVVQDDHVLLLHQSVKDFLTGSGADYINECDAHAMVAERCVDHFIRHFHTDPGCKLSDDGFLSYSIYSWTYHAARAQSAFIVQDSQAEFFAKDSKCRDHWNEHCRFTYRGRTRFSILHAAAWEGIPALVEFLFRDDVENSDSGAKVSPYVDDEYSNPDCGTPLWVAVMRGHTDVAAKLLEKSVIGKGVAERVLLAALRSRSGEAALLLLDRYRGKITFTEKMMRAVFPNNLGIMKSLLDWGATHVEASDAETNAASCSPPGSENIRAALDSNPHEVELVFTSKAIEAARNYNTNVFGLLFDEHHVTLTEAIARALEGSSIDVKSVMQLRFHRGQKRLAIVDKALLLTMRRSDKWVVGSLLDWTGIRTGARQDVLAAAAMNLRYGGEVVRLLLNRWGDQVTITEVVMKAAMENYSNGKEVIELLLDRPDGQKAITDMAASTAPKQENGNDSAVASPFYYDWDQFPDEVALELNDLAGKLWKLQFSHDGRRLAAVGERATVCIWHVPSFVVQWSLDCDGHTTDLEWSPDDSMILTCGAHVKLWDTSASIPRISIANCTDMFRPVRYSEKLRCPKAFPKNVLSALFGQLMATLLLRVPQTACSPVISTVVSSGHRSTTLKCTLCVVTGAGLSRLNPHRRTPFVCTALQLATSNSQYRWSVQGQFASPRTQHAWL